LSDYSTKLSENNKNNKQSEEYKSNWVEGLKSENIKLLPDYKIMKVRKHDITVISSCY